MFVLENDGSSLWDGELHLDGWMLAGCKFIVMILCLMNKKKALHHTCQALKTDIDIYIYMYTISMDNSRRYTLFSKLRSLDNKYFMFPLNEMKKEHN